VNPNTKESLMRSFSKKDVLDALGIEGESNWIPTALAGFGVGCVVGAAVAMLLAPKSGAELRRDIANTGRDLFSKAVPQESKSPTY
jgi:hypothetical protein